MVRRADDTKKVALRRFEYSDSAVTSPLQPHEIRVF